MVNEKILVVEDEELIGQDIRDPTRRSWISGPLSRAIRRGSHISGG